MRKVELEINITGVILGTKIPIKKVGVPYELELYCADCELYEIQPSEGQLYLTNAKFLLVEDYEDLTWVYLVDDKYNKIFGVQF